MADKNIVKSKRLRRQRLRVREKISGTSERPRLSVTKSLKNIFAQIIDDENRITLVAASSLSGNVKPSLKTGMKKSEVAKIVGEIVGKEAKEKGISSVVFDRNRNRFHGRIKAVAEGAREAGLKF